MVLRAMLSLGKVLCPKAMCSTCGTRPAAAALTLLLSDQNAQEAAAAAAPGSAMCTCACMQHTGLSIFALIESFFS